MGGNYEGTIGKTNWSLGEISERSFGRFDAEKPIWRNAAAIIENMLIGQACSVANRPGTQYVAATKFSTTAKSCLRKFTYSVSQEYIMEIGNLYLRFFSNFNGMPGQVVVPAAPSWVTDTAYTVGQYVTDGGVGYICMVNHTSGTFATDLGNGDWAIQLGLALQWTTSTSYVVGNFVTEANQVYYCLKSHTSGTFATDLAAGDWVLQSVLEVPTIFNQPDIYNLQTAQNADTMYIVNPNYYPQKLVRTSATSFTIVNVPFVRGPFLPINTTTTTITPSSATGSTILTASTAIFHPGHVGSFWQVGTDATVGNSGVVLITGYTDSEHVTGTVQPEPGGAAGNLGGTSDTSFWAEGAFSKVRGYPTSVIFFEGRLVYGGTTFQPQTFFESVVGAYDNFSTGTASDSDACTYTPSSSQSNPIRWLGFDTSLELGTSGGIITAADGNSQTGITPSSPPNITYDNNYGAMPQPPVPLGGFLFYIQANTFYIKQLTFDLITSKYKSVNMMVLADHILRDGLGAVQMASQVSPYDRIWVVRNDGQLAVFMRDPDQQVEGWSRIVGGISDGISPDGLAGIFESIDILPIDGSDDQVWVICNRKINGVFTRWVEVFTEELFNNYWEPIRLDASLTFNDTLNISNIIIFSTPVDDDQGIQVIDNSGNLILS